MLDPSIAHVIDARQILGATHGLDQSNLREVRHEFARYLSVPQVRSQHATWQAAWNAWTSATPARAGTIRFHTSRCPACHGKGYSHRNVSRNLARTGSPIACYECGGSRRGKWLTVRAVYITPPEPTALTSNGDTP